MPESSATPEADQKNDEGVLGNTVALMLGSVHWVSTIEANSLILGNHQSSKPANMLSFAAVSAADQIYPMKESGSSQPVPFQVCSNSQRIHIRPVLSCTAVPSAFRVKSPSGVAAGRLALQAAWTRPVKRLRTRIKASNDVWIAFMETPFQLR